MRILSVVTLITPLGEYGGPVRVALNQARELIAQGHDVVVAGAARGFSGPLPLHIDGVPVALFRARTLVPKIGFAGLAAPGLQRRLTALAAGVDVVHIHAARDFVTLPVAAWARRRKLPYVLQTHGMIDASTHPLARPLDAALTRRVLRGAKRVFFLTDREREDLVSVAGAELKLQRLANGVPIPADIRSDPSSSEVLYLARLAPRKRPDAFVEMALRLTARFPNASFRLVGPDEGKADEVMRRIGSAEEPLDIKWEGPLAPELVTDRMSRARIYVLPAVDEPYPMSVLEAMALGIPVVITESCGLAPLVREFGTGIVVDSSLEALVSAVELLLADPKRAQAMGDAGRRLTRDRLGMPAIADALCSAYVG